MRKHRTLSICLEGWYYLAVLAFVIGGAILREINLLIVLAGLMAGPLLLSLRLARATLRKVDVTRRMPEVIGAGDLLVVDVTVKNRRRRLDSWAVVVEEAIERVGPSRGAEKTSAQVLLPHVPADSSCTATYRGRIMRRGRYRFGPIAASTRFPLGLIKASATYGTSNELLVCPRLGQLSSKWTKWLQTEAVGAQASRRRHGLVEGDFYGLRDWRGGDSRSWIHWRTTARRGNLSVLQFERQVNQDLVIMLDLWEPEKPTSRQTENVELAVSFAATLLADRCFRGSSQITLATAAADVSVTDGAASKILMQETMEQLALAESTSSGNMPELLSRLLGKKRAGVRVVVVSTREVDLRDSDLFEQVWDDPQKRSHLRDVICINVGGEQVEELFTVK